MKKELAYYITLFKIKGHSTWRCHIASHPEGFKEQMSRDNAQVTDTRVIRVDRVEGLIQPYETN